MNRVTILNLKSLREQVYEYIRDEMYVGNILPNTVLNLSQISDHLGVSKTPLRDALIRLETEGFVTILPRRGVMVNVLSLEDVHNFYQIIGALEGEVLKTVFPRLTERHIVQLRELNGEMKQAIGAGNFDAYYRLNIQFHDVFLNLSPNRSIRPLLMPLKQRLYDFQRRPYVKDWEFRNTDEHSQLIDAIEQGDIAEAVRLLRDVHWSYSVQESFIRAFHHREFVSS